MREISLDTETTGLDPMAGHRIVEIGCVEMVNHMATGRVFHRYINPERDMPQEAFAVHGLSEAYLRDFPVFADVAAEFLDFIAADTLVIHNARFDMGFLNAELTKLEYPALDMARTIDTVQMARRKFPGAQANLDALCRRFAIDNTERDLHGALLDARLLAEVYLELIGGRQPGLELAGAKGGQSVIRETRKGRAPRIHAPTPEEEAAHAAFVDTLKEALWKT
ncbi:DNA polymerase III subunit epsilon [Varunaivibrio sulfuroxidans]|uniref:DNA polymerase III subunit epsilon n=1 Tax=Varunaivibrio sulfuroxidans TaxID=1773489 RepID=A0A4V2UP82_9PROT|nr:DNA polymerase III subunit epsilon [Varunaivibrio sulfuroxidans]TCS64871.1 DNA polymerase-3 subunit epsilon [Varunaivibrio sulfuroxidans]WES29832.1 DNA polymerase III subunit epsilon [Varunaivibrio sulfuroxidans]